MSLKFRIATFNLENLDWDSITIFSFGQCSLTHRLGGVQNLLTAKEADSIFMRNVSSE
jgi:hypothetical protein